MPATTKPTSAKRAEYTRRYVEARRRALQDLAAVYPTQYRALFDHHKKNLDRERSGQ